ncbi:uncharacterized protein [Pseudochaenichthys georgianus]|uniref:uncharacterized protein n=1 Tax=Pseudochaenichthys georgianus TaxID=52239 RepID=UPI00146B84ED|nr:uncharacterized protein LOC117444624 [Pseudochaenichthys georgianus]
MTSVVFFALLAFLGLTYGDVGPSNIAKGGKVTQSTIAYRGYPDRAIDGNRASVYNQRSCTQTRKQRNPWWRLDLQKTLRINTVTITNRKDCCSDRINGAEIRVGNSLKGRPNPVCAVISSIKAGTSKTFNCNGMKGRYVTIVIRGGNKILTLCEVEINGKLSGPSNIAKGGKVTQSTIAYRGYPDRAIDGNRASAYNQRSCTNTRKQRNPWWRLDLLKTYRINTVTITNRKDCCSDRINGAQIRVGNSLKGRPNPVCAVIPSIKAGTSKTFKCNGMKGRYVTIVIRGRDKILTLCEVEVTGTEEVNITYAWITLKHKPSFTLGNLLIRIVLTCASTQEQTYIADAKEASGLDGITLNRAARMKWVNTKPLTTAISAEPKSTLHFHSSSPYHESGWSCVNMDAEMVVKVMAAVETNPFTTALINISTGECADATVKDNLTSVKAIGLKALSELLSSDQKKACAVKLNTFHTKQHETKEVWENLCTWQEQ